MSEPRSDGQVALVTGSSRGIGRATVRLLAERGADVVVHYRRDAAEAEAAAREARELGRRALVVRADLAAEDEVRAMMRVVERELGHLDVLVANAASTAFKPLLDAQPHNVALTMQTVVHSALLLVQGAVPLMAGRRGSIVTVSGIDTVRVMRGHGVLAAAKAALETLTRYLAVELAPHGINVNAVLPGFVDTGSARTYAAGRYEGGYAEAVGEWVRRTPRGRVASPQEIARVIAFLCSPDADWIVGQVIIADGGWSLLE